MNEKAIIRSFVCKILDFFKFNIFYFVYIGILLSELETYQIAGWF